VQVLRSADVIVFKRSKYNAVCSIVDILIRYLCFDHLIRNQSLGGLMAKLLRAGLITRVPNEADRRVIDSRTTVVAAAALKRWGP
jgi:hypothetical protein